MAYKCIVIVREVWDTRDLTTKVLDGGQVKPGALATRFEPEDLNALEMALRVKDQHGGTVAAVSIGRPRGLEVLRECLYRGADAAYLVDAEPAALDTRAASALLAAAIRKIGAFDLVLSGVNVVEGENSLLGAHVAARLGLPQISYVDALVAIGDGKVTGRRAIEMGYEDLEAPLPALMTVGVALIADDPRTPRSAKAVLKLKAKKTEIPAFSPADLGLADVAAQANTRVAGRDEVPERVIQSVEVDPENETALKGLLDSVLKGAGHV
jgi:electron transfer flavoprotein beta subunit